MSQDDGSYDLTPPPSATGGTTPGTTSTPRPGEPGWVPPVPVIEKADSVDDSEATVDPDVEQNRGAAILGYFLFLLPLLLAPNSQFARFHANQGLLSFIAWCVAIVGNVAIVFLQILLENLGIGRFRILSIFLGCMFPLVQAGLLIAALALMIYGIVHAANGLKKRLAVIGQWNLIK